MSYYTPIIIVFVVLGVILLGAAILFICLAARKAEYRRFVNEHCESIKHLKEINKQYSFFKIPNYDMRHSYDNENMYFDISCKDYLIYQLVFIGKKVRQSLEDAARNRASFAFYSNRYKEECTFEKYDTTELPKNINLLKATEEDEFNKLILRPTKKVVIEVTLYLTNINGDRKTSKSVIFGEDTIRELLDDLAEKRNGYYLNEYIWNSICRVERGKVTNKMRFAVYERDGWRCRKCHRKTNDLEVDHIYPIAKGGKSTFDNLQTLCHRCNVKKGANIE